MSSLFERLGGAPAMQAAVDDFYRRILTDDRVAKFFEGVDMDAQIAKQRSFLTFVTGGPAEYSGQDLRQAHKHLVDGGLADEHVDAVVEHLTATLESLGVGQAEVQEVAALAESTRKDVLNR